MLPVIYKFTFDTPGSRLVLYLLAVALVIYGAWSGYRGSLDAKGAPKRAVGYGLFSAVIAVVAMQYALPTGIKPIPFLGSFRIPLIDFDFNGPGKNFGAPLHTYGLLIATAFIVAIYLTSREVVRAYPGEMKIEGKWQPAGPIMRDHILDLAFYVLVAGLVGSRIVFIIVNFKDYKSIADVLSISGGLVWYGGFIGGALVVLWYALKYQLAFLRLADVITPAVSIAHAIGRIGCFSAGCCWGRIASESTATAVHFPSASKLPFGGFGTDALAYATQLKDTAHWVDKAGKLYDSAVPDAVRVADEAARLGTTLAVHPTQLYESVGELILFTTLVLTRRTKKFHGQIFATWLCLYAPLRTLVETFRGDEERGRIFNAFLAHPSSAWWNLSTSQFTSLLIFATGAYLFVKYGRKAMMGGETQAA